MAATQELLLGEGAGGPAVYVEDVFSTYLYTGTAASLTITNNIDLSTKGGMVWLKVRSGTTGDHEVFDTVRGATNRVIPNATNGQITTASTLTAFNTNGFSIGNYSEINGSGNGMVSWTFREQPKFFDVVTYTGTGVARTVAHNLGSVPGCIMIKQTSASGQNWRVYHRSLDTTGSDQAVSLNLASSAGGGSGSYWNYTNPTSSVFTVGTDDSVNANGATYVAYIFAHDAGGFGLTGADNVISCGSYTGSASAPFPNINLGYEPQWLLIKNITSSGTSWVAVDNMRGFSLKLVDPFLYANTAAADTNSNGSPNPTSTGFTFGNADSYTTDAGQTYIYIAIRRGPMRVPTDPTKVFNPKLWAGTSSVASITGVGFVPDTALIKNRAGSADSVDWCFNFFDKLRAPGYRLSTAFTNAEDTSINFITSFDEDGITFPATGYTATNGSYNYIDYFFQRAPQFMDEVPVVSTGSPNTNTHNLGVVPEMIISKYLNLASNWYVYHKDLNGGVDPQNYNLTLNSTAAAALDNFYNAGAPTSTQFYTRFVSTYTGISYLFATCAGVSKVGSYTGTGTLTTINCGFTGGARFVLIKRTDTTGAWYVWDSSRGMVVGTDPSLMVNAYNAESNANSVYTITTGFQLLASPAVDVNTNGGSYIFLAIA